MTKYRARAVLAIAVLLAGAWRQAAPPAVNEQRLLRDLETLSADAMEGRRAGTPGGGRARAYIVQRFKEVGIAPIGGSYEHPFTFKRSGDSATVSGANVVGAIRGRRDGPWIAITAHYDHLGIRKGTVFNGADDNASGVAALLAIAEALRASPPEHPVLFAALDAEEDGLIGARELLKKPPVPITSIALNLNLDMVGRDAANRLYASGTSHYPFLKRHLEGAAAAPVELLFGHDRAGTKDDDWTRDSDHFAFHELGIPFVYFGVEDEAQHHKATDDAETITKPFFIAATKTIVEAARRFDRGLEEVVAKK